MTWTEFLLISSLSVNVILIVAVLEIKAQIKALKNNAKTFAKY